MEGENLYKTSSEKKFLRKVAGDKDAPDVVSHSAQEDLARIKDDLSGLIGKEGGLQKTKERFLKDKGEAERQVQTGSLDLEGAVDSMKGVLALRLHPAKIHIMQWHRGVDILGFVSSPTKTILRTKTRRRMIKRLVEASDFDEQYEALYSRMKYER